ncbi:MAG: GGDEF and EAL domain-containing protein [Azospirillaceae bacterium]|nr:GGDEF and EAL domain-containing protein [Azospirillaceae bacterium]
MVGDKADSERLKLALAASGDLIYDWDLVENKLYWVGDVEERLKVGAIDTIDDWLARIHAEDLKAREAGIRQAIDNGVNGDRTIDCGYRLRRGDGSFVLIHERGTIGLAADGQPVRLLSVLRLMDRHQSRIEDVAFRVNFDSATGLLNRTRLHDALQRSIEQRLRDGAHGGYLALSVDGIAAMREAQGQGVVDIVLREIAHRIEREIRAGDVLGRVADDGFGMVLDRIDSDALGMVAIRLLRLVHDRPLETSGGPLPVTLSIGAVSFPEIIRTAFEAMLEAEAEVEIARRHGPGRCHVAVIDAARRREHEHHRAIGDQVMQALNEQRLAFAYQPVIDPRSGSAAFWECLLRVRQSEGPAMVAGAFIPALERLGLIRVLDHRVLEMAIADLMAAPDARLAINISGFTTGDRSWLRLLSGMVGRREDLAQRLTIEVTETAAITDIEETSRMLNEIRDLGCQVALDDFGVGFMSFRYLRSLPANIVKLDGSYVRGLRDIPENQAFVRKLVGLAHGFGMTVVAECIETAEDVALLTAEGVDLLQGWHFGRPQLRRPWTSPQNLLAAVEETT